MINRLLKWLLIGLLLAHVLGLCYLANWGWNQVFKARQIKLEDRQFSVPEGSSLNQVLESLARKNLGPPAFLVRGAIALKDKEIVVKKGTYQLPEKASTWRILELLDEGAVILHKITIPEGLDKWEVAELLGASQWGDEATFTQLISNPSPIAGVDSEAKDLEGYLFPETYHFEATATPEEVINALVQEYLKQTKAIRADLASRGLSVRQWTALASLVEAESAVASERATIAGVFSKRLERGMLLQCDPTIVYSLKLTNRYRGKIYRSDIRYEHPYNTYTSPGLPPGPICSPGLAALKAAHNPENTGYLYFVARNDGTHHFSKTLREHNRAVHKYQR